MNGQEAAIWDSIGNTNVLIRLALLDGKLMQRTLKYLKKSVIVLSDDYVAVKRFALILKAFYNGNLYECTLESNDVTQYGDYSGNVILVNTSVGKDKKVIEAITETAKNPDLPACIIYAKSPETIPPEFADIEGISFDFAPFKNYDFIDRADKITEPDGEYALQSDVEEDDYDYEDDEEDYDYDYEDDDYEEDNSRSNRSRRNYANEEYERRQAEEAERQRERERELERQERAARETEWRTREAAREAAKAPIKAQIAALKAQLAKEKAAYMQKNGIYLNGIDRRPIDELERQIKNLEDQLMRL